MRVLARRDRFDRFVSVLVYVPRERYSGAGARADRRISRRGVQGPRQRLLSVLPRSAAGARALHHRPRRRRDARSRPRDAWRARSARSCAPGPTRFAEALAEAYEPGRAGALFERYRDAFSDGYREAYSPASRGRGHPRRSRACRRSGRSASISITRSEDGRPCVGLKVWSHGRPIPLSERVPVLENMGFRVVDEHTFEVGGRDAGRRLAARHGAGARRRRRRSISTR